MKEGYEKRALFGVRKTLNALKLELNFSEETNDHER
jgi:hypothetical protein